MIQRVIASRVARGAVVHHEGTRRPTAEELAGASLEVQRGVEKAIQLQELSARMFGKIGLVHQKHVLPSEAGWENHDATMLDVVERLGEKTLHRQMSLAKLVAKSVEYTKDPDKQRELILNNYARPVERALSGSLNQGRIAKLLFRNVGATIVDYRNDIALSAVDRHFEAAPGSELALIWGAGHLAGLGAGLEARGYEQADEQIILALDGAAVQLA